MTQENGLEFSKAVRKISLKFEKNRKTVELCISKIKMQFTLPNMVR
jgi:hypothetical protein